jgi:amino acid adenylation domain-containing protein/thioester reductase-like protein
MRAEYSNLSGLFASIAERYGDRMAIKDCKRSLTYRELYHYACGVSAILKTFDVCKGERIVCIGKKKVESIICFWGILQCGAIPVMLDHEDGMLVNQQKIKEVKAKAIVLYKQNQLLDPEFNSITQLDFTDLDNSSGTPDMNLPSTLTPDICYILLTSGTTGKPKAVQISHGNVLHYAFSIYEKIGYPEKVNAIHASTFAADLGLTNFLVALVSGGMLRILNKEESTDPAIFGNIIDEEDISLVKITPSHLLALLSDRSTPYRNPIENIILGGEKLSWDTVKFLYSLKICSHLYNHYGPTETTIGAIAFKIEESSEFFNKTGSVPLGSPLGKGHCFLLASGESTGELCITGPGVSSGYFENEQENNRKFFLREVNGQMELCYRTGDICRELKGGNYEFLYRTDRQVKVKGYRIELGEIEQVLNEHPEVENAIVTLSDSDLNPVIEAYIKPIKGSSVDRELIRKWSMKMLPGYKIPSGFYFYSRTPYNSNGKVDLAALKKMAGRGNIGNGQVIDEQNATWPVMATNAWERVLRRSEIQETDNFFEIGGDSLMAIQLIGRLQRYGYNIRIADLNANSVLSDFIAVVPSKGRGEENTGIIGKLPTSYTLSQRCFLQQEAVDLNTYCQTILLETNDNIRIREMAIALNNVLESHSALTTIFRSRAGQYVKERRRFSRLELGTSILDGGKSISVQIQDISRALLDEISLIKGALFVAHIFVDPAGKDYIYLACHHLVIDVISWNIIIDELLDFYEQALNNKSTDITAENTIDSYLGGCVPASASAGSVLMTHKPRMYKLPKPEHTTDLTGGILVNQVVIPGSISDILQQMDKDGPASILSGVLLSALSNALLEELSIQAITIDVEFHGRPQRADIPDLSRSVGWWATTSAVNILKGQTSPMECAGRIEECARLANNINLFCDTLPSIPTERPDVRFNYLGHFPEVFGNHSIQMVPSSFNPGSTRNEKAQQEYKLYFTARFIGDTLQIDLQYSLKRFSRLVIDNVLRRFFDHLNAELRKEHEIPSSMLSICESNLPSVGQPLYNMDKNNRREQAKKRCIFLTGATGFLGIHLAEVLARDDSAEIYCLVRGESQKHATHRLDSHYQYFFKEFAREREGRIHVIKGDILLDRFGMDPSDYNRIVGDADLILHAAADINLFRKYTDLIQTNIASVKNIIELAEAGRKKEVHYVSTLAVSGSPKDGIDKDFSENDFGYDQEFISDYERSKFEAEKMIRHFLREGGLGKIYRVGHIAADSLQGKFQQNIEHNRIFQIIRGIILLNKIPDTYNELLSFSYVDIVSAAIAHFCLRRDTVPENCYHVDNPHYLSFIEIVEMLQQIGYDVEIAEMGVFKDAIANFEGTENEKRAIDLMDNWIQRSINFPRRVNYIHRNTVDLMAKAGLYFPKTGIEWMSRMVREGVKTGYFKSPAPVRLELPSLANVGI